MWVLIRKDLLRRWRSPLATIVMIVFPLFMSLAIGSISGRQWRRVRISAHQGPAAEQRRGRIPVQRHHGRGGPG